MLYIIFMNYHFTLVCRQIFFYIVYASDINRSGVTVSGYRRD